MNPTPAITSCGIRKWLRAWACVGSGAARVVLEPGDHAPGITRLTGPMGRPIRVIVVGDAWVRRRVAHDLEHAMQEMMAPDAGDR